MNPFFFNPHYYNFMPMQNQMPMGHLPLALPNQMLQQFYNPIFQTQTISHVNQIQGGRNRDDRMIEVIEISDSEEEPTQVVQTCENPQNQKKELKKAKPDRFLGFKEGIFNDTATPNIKNGHNLRERNRKTKKIDKNHKKKISASKFKEQMRLLSKRVPIKKVDKLKVQNRNERRPGLRRASRKPMKRQFSKLKRHLRQVTKTVNPEPMVVSLRQMNELVSIKRENLLARLVEQEESE